MLISPQASAMEHHVPDPAIAVDWARPATTSCTG